MVKKHDGTVINKTCFTAVHEWLKSSGEVSLKTEEGTPFTARAETTKQGAHSGKPVIRFFQNYKEYARSYKCCWGHYYNCNKTRIGMYCKALDLAVYMPNNNLPNEMTILEPSTLSEAFSAVVDFISSWTSDNAPYCWFRGVKDNTLSLQPGAYWRDEYEEVTPLVMFAQEGITYRPIDHAYSWRTYYLAQHHGIPTRLLDWTESFSAALFFALDAWNGESVPCIWIMQPCLLNEKFIGWDGVVAPEQGEQYNIWLTNKVSEKQHIVKQDSQGYCYDNDWPLLIYPKKTNARIAAQQGNFTIHGRRREPIDSLFIEKGGDLSSAFARVDLIDCDKEKALRHLSILGVKRSAIYPDIDNLVRQIREDLEW